jgi:hypothetical protein
MVQTFPQTPGWNAYTSPPEHAGLHRLIVLRAGNFLVT